MDAGHLLLRIQLHLCANSTRHWHWHEKFQLAMLVSRATQPLCPRWPPKIWQIARAPRWSRRRSRARIRKVSIGARPTNGARSAVLSRMRTHSLHPARRSPFLCVLGLPHVTLIELRLTLVSYQDYHMLLLTLAGHTIEFGRGCGRVTVVGVDKADLPG